MKLIITLLVNSLALYVTDFVISGIKIPDGQTLLVAAIVIGVVNTVIKPLAQIVSLPLTLLTFGIFALFVNAAMLGLAAWIVPNFVIENFLSALLGTIVLSITSTVLNGLVESKRNSAI